MSEEIAKHALQNLEDGIAQGLSLESIALDLGMTEVELRKWVAANIPVAKAVQRGRQRLAMHDGDKARRRDLEKMSKWFVPTDEELAEIESRIRLGWSEVKIADSFDVPMSVWRAAKKATPELESAIKRGLAGADGKKLKFEILTWKPTKRELTRVTELAAEGYTQKTIAVQLGINSATLSQKMAEMPELKEAYEAGTARLEQLAVSELVKHVKKGTLIATIFLLKSRFKQNWTDAAPKAEEIQVDTARDAVVQFPSEGSDEAFAKEGAEFRKQQQSMQEKREADKKADLEKREAI